MQEYAPNATLEQVDKPFILGFIDYLRGEYRMRNGEPLSQKSIFNLVGMFSSSLNYAVSVGKIDVNPYNLFESEERVKPGKEHKREYLTIEELKRMIATPCKSAAVKQVFLFTCFTGLRLSDVRSLRWCDLSQQDGSYTLGVKMYKTEKMVYIPLSKLAMKWMPERGDKSGDDFVFDSVPQSHNDYIAAWAKEAGITKHITHHCGRHTFATMLLSLGVDIYTVSKLLGHASLRHTQRYAKIVDQQKHLNKKRNNDMARTVKLKEPVRIRFKELADGSKSIYLDIYKDGVRRYEFLTLYIHPGKSEAIRRRNAATLAAAETIKSQRVIALTNNQAGIPNTGLRSKMLLSDWMQEFYESQIRKGVKGQKLLLSATKVLKQYAPKARMRDVNKEFCLGYIDFLRNTYKTRFGKPLTPYGAISYFGFLRTALNAAVRAQVIVENPINRITQNDKIKMPESQRIYLTIDEVKMMIATPCTKDIVRRAFLFACYCGMRLSDVSGLRWKDLSKDGDQWRASIVMRKTSAPLYLPLSNQALKWMPERGDASDEDKVFATLPHEASVLPVIKRWAKDAGIAKNVNFHTSRHTFATILLTLGADIYTVSKLLDHTNVKTTQIYAKIVNKKKEDAVSLVDNIFD